MKVNYHGEIIEIVTELEPGDEELDYSTRVREDSFEDTLEIDSKKEGDSND
jgi:hypothetical protein